MDVAAWLQGLGLERYVPAFRDNEIDWEALPKLTAFGIGRCRGIMGRRCPGGGGLGAERGDGVEELAAVASEHHAEILEILRRQLRQRFLIDLVVAESRLIPLEAQASQPRRYVHAPVLGGTNEVAKELTSDRVGDTRPSLRREPATLLPHQPE